MTENHNHLHQDYLDTIIRLENEVPQNLEFEYYDPKSDKSEKITFEDLLWKWSVIVFYPADFTFVCPTELKDLQKSSVDIMKNPVNLFVASTDTIFSHKRWIETEPLLKDFDIKMISDRNWVLSMLFGVLDNETGNAQRWTFIISPDLILKSIEITTEPLGRSSFEIVRKINALEFMRNNPWSVCPASWNIWLKTLKPSLQMAGNVWKDN